MIKKIFSSIFLSAVVSLGSVSIATISANAETSMSSSSENDTKKDKKKKKKKELKEGKTSNMAKNAKDINVNTATEDELITINGIGKSLAKKLIAYRKENGKINSIDDLKKISGFGPQIIEKVKTQIVF